MPLRKKITQILRRISGMPQTSTQVQQQSPVEVQTTSESTPPVQLEKEATASPSVSYTTSDLILYGRPSCPYCARVDRVIKELGIEDTITRRLTSHGSEWRTDLRNRTGSTQVPCLFIDGEPLFESVDIINWMRSNLV